MIVAGKMKELKDMDFGEPLHSFIVTGDCHVCELETLAYYATEATRKELSETHVELAYMSSMAG